MNTEDLQELKSLYGSAKRARVKVFLENEIVKLEASLAKPILIPQPTAVAKKRKPKGIVTFLSFTSYYWDETATKLKVYIDFDELEVGDSNKHSLEFPFKNAFHFRLSTSSKHRELRLVDLHGELDPDGCKVVLKKKKAILILAKAESGKWFSLKKSKNEPKMPEIDKKADPNDSMMNLMKKMYEEGDDDMKRMLNKTWHESRMKQQAGGDMGGPSKDDDDD